MCFLSLLAREAAEFIIGHTFAKCTLYFLTIYRQVYRALKGAGSRARFFV